MGREDLTIWTMQQLATKRALLFLSTGHHQSIMQLHGNILTCFTSDSPVLIEASVTPVRSRMIVSANPSPDRLRAHGLASPAFAATLHAHEAMDG
ncbi:hypothetical protein RRG08_034192 [Elysia crispata]|uniref:Uncharacterized protein n=1 Tax=Elysia crispata TaxID=231223 RepID=A0AAE1A058_9GAST|nr:hypothetical protein RRG08_034192 [Elysia crispata]